jgi:uncharacterized membrane protein (UPF0127 family)
MAKNNNRKGLLLKISGFVLLIAFAASYILTVLPSNKYASVKKQKVQKVEVPFTKHGEIQILDNSDKEIAKFDMEIADTPFLTGRGLMYRSILKENHGMLFIFDEEVEKHFYMRNTRISLDIIYADKNKKIVSIVKNAKPYDETSLPSKFPAQYVFEINGGFADKLGIEPGQYLKWKRDN